jgi:hypothetical protein
MLAKWPGASGRVARQVSPRLGVRRITGLHSGKHSFDLIQSVYELGVALFEDADLLSQRRLFNAVRLTESIEHRSHITFGGLSLSLRLWAVPSILDFISLQKAFLVEVLSHLFVGEAVGQEFLCTPQDPHVARRKCPRTPVTPASRWSEASLKLPRPPSDCGSRHAETSTDRTNFHASYYSV